MAFSDFNPPMLSLFLLALALQNARVGARAPVTTPSLGSCLNSGAAEHFADGIDVSGKLVWPSNMIPQMVDIELEDEDGNPIDSTKSQANNQFFFRRVKVVNPVTCAFKTYNIVINSTEGLDNVRQQLSLSTNNFAGAQISIQVKPIPGAIPRNSEFVVSIDALTKEPPRDAVSAFDKAMDESRKGDIKKSSDDLGKAVRIDPDFYEANVELGIQYQETGRHDEAERLLKHAIQVNPASMKARASLGKRAYELNDFQRTVDLLTEAVRLGNISGDVYFMLGVSQFKLENFTTAEASLQRALAISPGMGVANLALYNVYLKRRQLDKALVQLDTYVEKHPNAPDRERVQTEADKIRKVLHP